MIDEKAARLAAIRAANGAKATGERSQQTGASRPAVAAPAALAEEELVAMPLSGALGLLLATLVGALGAALLLPAWLPGLSQSLLGAEPKAYWYLSRASAGVAFGLLWLAMVFGLLMTNRIARLWPGGPAAFDMHQHASLLGLAFGLFHALILLGDGYMNYSLAQLLLPFASSNYQPLWVGLGQVAFYLLVLVGLSFYARPWIGRRGWRVIHFISFAVFALVLLHGIASGSDSSVRWVQTAYWFCGGSVLFLTIYRVLVTVHKGKAAMAQA